MTTEPKVKLALTLKEANAMRRALGNSTDWEDAMESLFPDKRERNAAYRAIDKLGAAIRMAHERR